MTTIPFERHELFRATDLVKARELSGLLFRPFRLDYAGAVRRVNARAHGKRVGRMLVGYFTYGGDVFADFGPLGYFAVQIPLSGWCVVRLGDQTIMSRPGYASMISATEPLQTHWSFDCAMLVFAFERSDVEACLHGMLAAPVVDPIVFDVGIDVTTGKGQDLANTALYPMVDMIDRDNSFFDNEEVVAEFEHSLMSGLLFSQPNNYTAALEATILRS